MKKIIAFRFAYPPGVNFGNCYDAPNPGDWGPVITEDDFKRAKEMGVGIIRLPVRWSTHMDGEGMIEGAFFKQIDWAIDRAQKYGFGIIVNDHHDEAFIADPTGQKSRFLSMWHQIVDRYYTREETLVFELLNEAAEAKITVEGYNSLIAEALESLCKIDSRHVFMIGGINWNNLSGLQKLEIPIPYRHRVVLSWHNFEPQLFTHQGTCKPNTEWGWSDPFHGTEGVSFPGPPESPIAPCFASTEVPWCKAWFDGFNTVKGDANPASYAHFAGLFSTAKEQLTRLDGCLGLSISEFGVYGHAPQASSERWYRAFKENAEIYGFHWIAWQWRGNFEMIDPLGKPTYRAEILFLEPSFDT